MNKEYTAEENRIWRAAQPQKMIVVKVIIKSDEGKVLLAKSSYKKTWQFPGGGVEDGESPQEAVVREAKEELNLDILIKDLVLKDTIYKKDEEMLFIIYEKQTSISEGMTLVVQEDEITDYKFFSINEVEPLLSSYYSTFWQTNYLLA